MIADFLEAKDNITAIFTVNVRLAHMVHSYLRKHGLLDRIELMTFDIPDIPGVSYVAQNIESISRNSIEMLKAQLTGENVPQQHLEPVKLCLHSN